MSMYASLYTVIIILMLTLITQCPFKAWQTVTLSRDMVTWPIAMDALWAGLTAAVAKVPRRANCREIHLQLRLSSTLISENDVLIMWPDTKKQLTVDTEEHVCTHSSDRWCLCIPGHTHKCLHLESRMPRSYSCRAGSSWGPSGPQHTHCHSEYLCIYMHSLS